MYRETISYMSLCAFLQSTGPQKLVFLSGRWGVGGGGRINGSHALYPPQLWLQALSYLAIYLVSRSENQWHFILIAEVQIHKLFAEWFTFYRLSRHTKWQINTPTPPFHRPYKLWERRKTEGLTRLHIESCLELWRTVDSVCCGSAWRQGRSRRHKTYAFYSRQVKANTRHTHFILTKSKQTKDIHLLFLPSQSTRNVSGHWFIYRHHQYQNHTTTIQLQNKRHSTKCYYSVLANTYILRTATA